MPGRCIDSHAWAFLSTSTSLKRPFHNTMLRRFQNREGCRKNQDGNQASQQNVGNIVVAANHCSYSDAEHDAQKNQTYPRLEAEQN